ncbi:MAG: hypothetical protein U5R31_14620 [Acidimicrobiia bacterium]|nr:hypothetical protein [Acidimicrobiia bacterium]
MVTTGRRQLRPPAVSTAFGAFFGAWGLAIGGRPLGDNSFLTHLATGRLILERGEIPGSDPYTFVAAAEPWVVQSWLVSTAFAVAESAMGMLGVRILVMATTALLGCLVWTLTRSAGALSARILLSTLAMCIATFYWSERPLLVGYLGVALVLLVVEDRVDPRWLLPAMWVWVNSHGSFPLALVIPLVWMVGARLDRESLHVPVRALAWAGAGTLLGAIGPIGPTVLLFPLDLVSSTDNLSRVIEWQSPSFDDLQNRIFLIQLALAVVLVARRPSYQRALAVALATGMALLAARNVPVASLLLLPVMASGLEGVRGVVGKERSAISAGRGRRSSVSLGLVVEGWPAGRTTTSQVGAASPLDRVLPIWRTGGWRLETRLVTHDYVGNYLEFRDATPEQVFMTTRRSLLDRRRG